MSGDDLKLYVMLFEFALDNAKFQTSSVQMCIGEIEKMQSLADLLRRLDRLPDGDEKNSMRAKIERLEFEFDSRIAFEDLKPLLKKSADEQAKLAGILAVLKKGQS